MNFKIAFSLMKYIPLISLILYSSYLYIDRESEIKKRVIIESENVDLRESIIKLKSISTECKNQFALKEEYFSSMIRDLVDRDANDITDMNSTTINGVTYHRFVLE
jgi:hypothetical protein